MEVSSDVEGDLVGEVFEYLLSQWQILRWSVKGKKATIRKKALKFSVSSRGELFYRQKRKGKARSVNMGSSCKHFIWNPFLVNTQVDWAFSYRWGMMWQTKQTVVQMDQL